ncbi:MAG: cytochrome C [Bryobacteraceae bacterium]
MSRTFTLLAGVSAGVIIFGLSRLPLHGQDQPLPTNVPDGVISRIRALRGLYASPVPLNLDGKNPVQVGLGSYIVNGPGGCNDCHTNPAFAPGGSPYMGQPVKINVSQYLTGGKQFGPFTSRNLTPNPAENNEPAGLDADEFRRAFQHGEDIDRKHPQLGPLLQIMPWPSYSNMTSAEVDAVYAYLQSIPALPDNPNPAP